MEIFFNENAVFEAKLQELECAVDERNLDKVSKILSEKNFFMKFGDRNLYSKYHLRFINAAINNKDIRMVKMLLSFDLNQNITASESYTISPLWNAINTHQDEITKVLIFLEADVNCRGRIAESRSNTMGTPLHKAAQLKKESLCSLLLNHGADVNALNSRQECALHYALDWKPDCMPIVQLLLERGAQVNIPAHQPSLLLLALELGNGPAARLLLNYGADPVWTKDYTGRGVLHYIARAYIADVELARLFLEAGVNVDQQDMWNVTPLHDAAKMNNVKMVKLLLEHGANVNAKSKFDHTPTYLAAFRGNAEVIDLILKKNPDVNVETHNQSSSLLVACATKNRETICALLKYGVNINIDRFQLSTLKILIKYVVILCTQKVSVCKQYLEILNASDNINCKLCLNEIEAMKTKYFFENYSFYNIFTKRQIELARLIRNKAFVLGFEKYKCNVKETFPVFGEDLLANFSLAMEKFQDISLMEHTLNSILYEKLPTEIIVKIVDYLKIDDLNRAYA